MAQEGVAVIGRPRPDYFDRLMTAGVVICFVVGTVTTGKAQALVLVLGIAIELTRLVLL